MLHLFYRLVVQPNTTRAHTFAEAFLACGGVETLLVLLQREAKTGDSGVFETMSKSPEPQKATTDGNNEIKKRSQDDERLVGKSEAIREAKIGDSGVFETISKSPEPQRSQDDERLEGKSEATLEDKDQGSQQPVDSGGSPNCSTSVKIERMESTSETPTSKNLGGISLSISADNARNNVYNVDKSDGIVVGIIGLLGALVASGHLKIGSQAAPDTTRNLLGVGLYDGGGTMFDDKVSLLLYALQKAFQAAPNRLMTNNVCTALMAASV